METPQLVWLITGTTSGLGRDLALAALKRGEKVIATGRGRSIAKLNDLKAEGADILELDVTSSLETLHEVAKKAVAIYGHIDVLVNNAGYIHCGTIEESSHQETLDQFNTNVFGVINVTRAFLPHMREKRSGTVVFTGSLGGWMGGPYAGLYASTKWALRGISYSLHQEISSFGLRATCIDFGYFRTSILHTDQRTPKVERISDYRDLVQNAEKSLQGDLKTLAPREYNGKQPGDPSKGVKVVIDIVRGEGLASNKPFPLGVCLGTDSYNVAKTSSETALMRLEDWKEVSFSTDF